MLGSRAVLTDGGFTLRADRTGGARDLLAVLRLQCPSLCFVSEHKMKRDFPHRVYKFTPSSQWKVAE